MLHFTLSGVIAWVGKQAQLSAKPLSLGNGRWLIAQAITKWSVEARGPGCPHSIPPVSMPFSFHNQDLSPQSANLPVTAKRWVVPWLEPQAGQQEWGQMPQWGQNQGQRQQELWMAPPQSPSLLSDHGFESDRSTASTSSSVSSMSERSGGLRHPCGGQHPCWELGGHMKINLPVFKDEDNKDAITYQSWHWDLTVYHHAGCWDCTLLPYAICSLQGYPGELVRSSGMDIILDNVLTILDEHYNNVKALDALNQELFQLHMGEKETVSEWGVCLSRHLQILAVSFPECLPPDHVAKLKHDHFYSRLPKWIKAMMAYLKASANEKMYSDYFWAAREAEKEEAMEPCCSQTTNKTSKTKVVSFFPPYSAMGYSHNRRQ